MQVVSVGGCWCDFVSISARLPKKGETILGTQFLTQHGGKAANVAVTVSNLKGKSVLIAKVGDDFWGEKRIKSLTDLKVDTKCVQKSPDHHTGIAMINLTESGDNQIVGIPGANYQLTVDDIEKHRNIIQRAEIVVATLEIPVESTIRALELSTKISILNAAPAYENCDPALFTLPTVFVVNETEASLFSGISILSLEDSKKAVVKLLEMGCNMVVITLGKNGVLFGSEINAEPIHIPSPEVNCVDSTGAGDAFVGVMAYLMAYRKEMEMVQIIEAAAYCAAYTVTVRGSQESLPKETILQKYFLEKIKQES